MTVNDPGGIFFYLLSKPMMTPFMNSPCTQFLGVWEVAQFLTPLELMTVPIYVYIDMWSTCALGALVGEGS